MRWQELRERLAADPEYRQALARELPYRALALSVARLRGVHDLTQAEFAERVGTTQSVIARLESGRHAPNLKLLERVANAFDLDWHVTFTPHLPVRAASVAADMPHRGTELQQVLNPSVVAVRMGSRTSGPTLTSPPGWRPIRTNPFAFPRSCWATRSSSHGRPCRREHRAPQQWMRRR